MRLNNALIFNNDNDTDNLTDTNSYNSRNAKNDSISIILVIIIIIKTLIVGVRPAEDEAVAMLEQRVLWAIICSSIL